MRSRAGHSRQPGTAFVPSRRRWRKGPTNRERRRSAKKRRAGAMRRFRWRCEVPSWRTRNFFPVTDQPPTPAKLFQFPIDVEQSASGPRSSGDRASASGAESRRFESYRGHQSSEDQPCRAPPPDLLHPFTSHIMTGCSYGETMKTLVITVTVSVALIATIAWVLSWITLLDAVAAVAVALLIALVLGRLRETAVKIASNDEGQRHHRGRGGGGLM